MMGTWNNHGMDKDAELVEDAVNILGLHVDELVALADHAEREAWVWAQLHRTKMGQEKRKAGLISGHFKRRARKWKELAATLQQELDEGVPNALSELWPQDHVK